MNIKNFITGIPGAIAGNAGSISHGANDVGSVAKAIATVGAAGLALDAVGREIGKAHDINATRGKLIEYNPELASVDKKKIDDYFDIVKLYSPHAARNPLVAGSLINKMVQFGGVDHKLVQDISSLEDSRGGVGDALSQVMSFKPHDLSSYHDHTPAIDSQGYDLRDSKGDLIFEDHRYGGK